MTVRSIVLDANIYVSALVFGGKPKRAWQLAIAGRVDLAISDPIRNEVRRTLRNKFHWSDERVAEADDLIGATTRSVVPTEMLKVVERDPDDDRVLECAVTANADLLVTGDLDLLSLGDYEGIRIIQVAEFLELVASDEP